MKKPGELSDPDIEVILAKAEQQPTVANLLQLYAHDFSEFYNVEIELNGRFGYPPLPLYWSEPDRYPFLVKIGGNLAGFVLVKRGSEISGNLLVWNMAEFFVLRAYRRRGIGTQIANEVWRRFPGLWEIRVMPSNVPAHPFWERAISRFTGEKIDPVFAEKDGRQWAIYSFNSNHAA